MGVRMARLTLDAYFAHLTITKPQRTQPAPAQPLASRSAGGKGIAHGVRDGGSLFGLHKFTGIIQHVERVGLDAVFANVCNGYAVASPI